MQATFPKRLKYLREKKHLKRIVLSSLCGLVPEAIRKYERGDSQPTLESLVAIADFFDVGLDYLTGRNDYP